MSYESPDGMEMPVQCDCGNWMELNDSWRREKEGADNTTICTDCHEKEEAEIDRDNEISDLKAEIEEAEYTLDQAKRRLAEIEGGGHEGDNK